MSGRQSPYRDTICALSSGSLPAGIAVIRVSGPLAQAIAAEMAGSVPEPGHLALRSIRKRNGELIDRGLVLAFKGPASFTGEDVVEFQLHGGKAVVAAALQEICRWPETRMAEAGEFARRAFVNGKMDLASSESLADLIEAATEEQRRLAVGSTAGEQAKLYGEWRRQIGEMRALLEAELDFSEEEDVPVSVADNLEADIESLVREIERHIAGYARAEIIREGFNVVLLGEPNTGKSSLLNALARRDVAIVSDEAGTTRDLIDVALDLDGRLVVVTDTAGLRERAGNVERIGMERALGRAAKANVVLWLVGPESVGYEPPVWDAITVLTKADLDWIGRRRGDHAISALDGTGIEGLLKTLSGLAKDATSVDGTVPTHRRQMVLLEECAGYLKKAALEKNAAELRAEYLREASRSLGRIAGEVEVEDLLDVIFSRFCVGK